ncbi:uncharacterized protein LOC110656896 [Hevea brasiliensis]|uniref:uncharacterized protein LOC110656896 n=1 Tax=Hevea brasiliensis TaxID=3981 RepID=UPI0025DEC725|nr:uncharacterized protein LOC110656896 [Hevea brasiliensis]
MIKFLEEKEPELQASRQAGLLNFIASALPASHTSKPEVCQVMIHLIKFLQVVLSVPANRSYFLAQNLLPPIIPMLSTAFENYIKIAASLNGPGISNLPSSKTSVENFESISELLDNFLWIVGAVIGHTSSDERELQMQGGLLELLIAYQVVHWLRDLFALYERPPVEGSPFPSSILLSIHLLVVLTYRPKTYCSIDWESSPIETVLGFDNQEAKPAEIAVFEHSSANMTFKECRTLLSVLNGSALVSSPDVSEDRPLHESCSINKSEDSLSIGKDGGKKSTYSSAELNYANINSRDVPDESEKILIEEKDGKHLVNVGVEQKKNNMSIKPPASFLLSAISETGLVSLPSLLTAVLLQANNRLSSEQVGLLLHESLLLLGYFALFCPENQAVLRWGKSPTILHKVYDLPFVFFSDPELMSVLGGMLVAACYGCEQNRSVVLQELSMDMILSLLTSCKSVSQAVGANQTMENLPIKDSGESNRQNSELKKSHGDIPSRSNRYNTKSTRVSLGKATVLGNGVKSGKMRSHRDSKATKIGEEMALKHSPLAPETSLMLHSRFPSSFLDRVEQFFSAGIASMGEV